jgi:hypothetical protein
VDNPDSSPADDLREVVDWFEALLTDALAAKYVEWLGDAASDRMRLRRSHWHWTWDLLRLIDAFEAGGMDGSCDADHAHAVSVGPSARRHQASPDRPSRKYGPASLSF